MNLASWMPFIILWSATGALVAWDRGRVGRTGRHPAAITAAVIAAGVLATVVIGVLHVVNRPCRCGGHADSPTRGLRDLFDASAMQLAAEEGLPGSAPMHPPRVAHVARCNEPDGAHAYLPAHVEAWSNHAVWSTLEFAIREPHRYSYQYDSSQVDGRWTFTASAFGDLDCDGQMSTFVRFGFENETDEVESSPGLFIVGELE